MSEYFLIESDVDLDAATLLRLKNLDQIFFPTPWSNESWDKLFYSVGKRLLLLAKQDQKLLGFALFDIVDADSFAHLLKIIIVPEQRQKGLGFSLLLEAISTLKKMGIKTFFLEVEETNLAAVALYKRAGFKLIHQKKQFYSNGASALIMTLEV